MLLIITTLCIILITLLYFKTKKPLLSDSKYILLINSSLKMSKGKIISQLAHALTRMCRDNTRMCRDNKNNQLIKDNIFIYEGSYEDIKRVCIYLHNENIKYNKIYDAGRTQIASGSNTVVCVGPLSNNNNVDLSGFKEFS